MIFDAATFRRRLLRWYDRNHRKLPWRVNPPSSGHPNPYAVLVSELMLQQTRVDTVIPYFHRFLREFPDFRTLAEVDLARVLHAWQGLGYYSRARNLHQCAREVVARFDGFLPPSREGLLELPGIGPYTASAVASIAFQLPEACVDGNVSRVLMRLDGIEGPVTDPGARNHVQQRASELLSRRRPGDFNSAMMDLGATICTPKSPSCALCPIRLGCKAHSIGRQESIPQAKIARPMRVEHRTIWCIRRKDRGVSRFLIEKRPDKGRWAGMWQFVTRPFGEEPGLPASKARGLGEFQHQLSHRTYRFTVMLVRATRRASARNCKWVTLRQLSDYPLPNPHRRVREMLLNKGE
jgi:A/G-specific adenine glycosylase